MRAVISTVAIVGAALLASACTSNETTNVTNTTEVVQPENVVVEDTMTNIDTAAPAMDNTVEMNTVETNSAMSNM